MHSNTKRKCSVEGCDRKVRARGMCFAHYDRWRKHGDPGDAFILSAGEKNAYEIRGDATAIFLRRRDGSTLEALIDTKDLERAQSISSRWSATWSESAKTFYVAAKHNGKSVRLHRWLVGNCEGLVIDHINHNGLDNRRENLRVVTVKENNHNRKDRNKPNGDTVTGSRNVYLDKATGKYRVSVTRDGKTLRSSGHTYKEVAEMVAQRFRDELYPPNEL